MNNSNCNNAIAIFDNKNVKGHIKFHQCFGEKKTIVDINLYNLKPNKIRAIHIHEYGDESEGCKSLGGHWNPKNHTHGCMFLDVKPKMKSHAGDMINNITPDEKGRFKFSYVDPRISLRGNINKSIIGRSVVIHDKEDDLGLGGNKESLKTGNAGKRLACAIIAIAKSGKATF